MDGFAYSEPKYEIGVVHGRFQGLHLGHIEYLLEAKRRCNRLIIGITNFDIVENKEENSYCAHRTLKEANPFTYYDRHMMIKLALEENNVPLQEFDIVPFPIEAPTKIKNFAPKDALYFVTIYDDWGKQKLKILNQIGLKTEVMWERSDQTRITSGTEIRKLISTKEEWQHLVPKAVFEYITSNGLTCISSGDCVLK